MDTNQKYYKVLDKNFKSPVAPTAIQYKVGEWNYPTIPGSKLCVFDNLMDAIAMSLSTDGIFECEVINPHKPEYPRRALLSSEHIKMYWLELNICKEANRDIEFKKACAFEQWPNGTLWADAVKLGAQVREYKLL